ncbi:MAG: carboxypeptidase-like regulatory domain-containing protein [Pyrinomonadaceae bacterium]
MKTRSEFLWLIGLFFLIAQGHALAQNTSASLNGEVQDEKEAAIPGASVTLKNVDTGIALEIASDTSGYYTFLNLPAANYELRISANGFQTYLQTGIRIALNEKARVDIQMNVGSITETLEVRAEIPQLNFDDATQSGSLEPKTVGDLPLIVAGGPRSAASFATLLPGVTTPDGDIIGARINGGVHYSGEAVLNGVSLVNPSGGNGTWSAAFDFPQSPDMVSELKVLTSNYEPQYGSTGGAVLFWRRKRAQISFTVEPTNTTEIPC